jgi:membrane protease YdiL (CAAX protease family)
MSGILMFPVMLFGPCIAGIALTRFFDGSQGVRNLFRQMAQIKVSAGWYAALLIPPVLGLVVLQSFTALVSSDYTPNRFFLGILFGVPAGLLEEIGWMGFAFPRMRFGGNRFAASVALGLLWSLWHLPVIDYLGTATPHGPWWLPFFLAFSAAMTAMRVLIAWIYTNTQSLLLAQLMHISSTGSLVVLSPRVTASQEVIWYACYGIALWVSVAIVLAMYGTHLRSES